MVKNNKGILMAYIKIHPIAAGLTLAILSGLSAFFTGLTANMLLNGKPLASMYGTMYITYNPSFLNTALGGLGAFIVGLIGGYVAAWLYNLLSEYI